LGDYRLIARLAHGGMGDVWEAEGPKGQVALKVIPEFLMHDRALVDRLRREAEAIRRLSHPGVVRLYDFGESEGRAYLAMELLKGETLAERMAHQSPLPVDEVERIGRGLAEALAYVHAKGIIHRDLKPQNVFLTEAGGVKLIDLGVAKVLDEASLTVTGSHFGTPAYMSPESFRDSKNVTSAADVWSLGVVLYEMSTGHLPFPGTTAASIIAKISDTNMTPQSPTLIRPEIPDRVAAVIGQSLDRDPLRRPSASALAGAWGGRSRGITDVDSEKYVFNKPKGVTSMKFLGFALTVFGVMGCLNIEGLHWGVLWMPSVLVVILLGAFGMARVSYSWAEIGSALTAFFGKGETKSGEAAADDVRVYAILSRSAMTAMWISMIVGAAHILGAFENIRGLNQIGMLAGGVALVLVAPVLGIGISYFVFDPMRCLVERRAGIMAFEPIQTRPPNHFGVSGLLLFAAGVWVLCKLEGVDVWSPSALVVILLPAMGGTLVAFRPSEIARAVMAFLQRNPAQSKEELMNGIQIFRLLSRYALAAMWIGLLIGTIHILGGFEETIQKYGWAQGTIRTIGWFSFALYDPLLGYILGSCIFASMRRNLERKAGVTSVG